MLKTFSSANRCPSSSWYFASANAASATCTPAWRVASSARVARESMLKRGLPAFTRLPTSTNILVTTPAISVPTAMFSVLVSTSPTAATVCAYDEAGGGEGGLVASCLGCERTTEMTPNVSAAIATIGRMNRLIDFQVSQHVRELSALATDEIYPLAVARVHDREAQERRRGVGDADDRNLMIVEFERATEFQGLARKKQYVARFIYDD